MWRGPPHVPHVGVAAHQGDGKVPTVHGAREVEGSDDAHVAKRVPPLKQIVAGTCNAVTRVTGPHSRRTTRAGHSRSDGSTWPAMIRLRPTA